VQFLRSFAPLLVAAVGVAGCGGGGSSTPSQVSSASALAAPTSSASATLPSDVDIADLVYTDRQRVPAGFYVEASRAGVTYATISHLRNVDLDPAATPPHELCASDFNTALQWSETVAAAQPVYGDLVGNETTARAWEFTRVLRTSPARTVVARVYRCQYLDRSNVDLRAVDGVAGTFAMPNWSADDLRSLGEYLWTFTIDNNAGNAVLRSDAAADSTGATHSIVMAQLVRASTSGECDRVDLRRIDLRGERAGGLTRTSSVVRSFGARRVGGVAQLCP
jgi:hypothetical protein